jgi:hemerythrin
MAGYFEWLDSYSVGIPSIDADHKLLVSLVNDVVTAIEAHHGRDVMNDALIRLIEYTAHHFEREEEAMDACHFPGLEAHRALHDRLIRTVLRLLLRYRNNELEPLELAEFLMDWLITHILEEDRKLGAHLRLHGAA